MNRRTISCLKSHFGLVAAGVLIGSGLTLAGSPAFARQIDQTPHHITVTGTRTVTRTIGHGYLTDAPIQLIKITRNVSYAHLNLATYLGATKLKTRIKSTAAALCTDLDNRFPFDQPNHATCVKETVARAMPAADKVIAAANRPAHKSASLITG